VTKGSVVGGKFPVTNVTKQSSDANAAQMVVMERTNQCQCKAEQTPGERYKEKTRVKAKYADTIYQNIVSSSASSTTV
jgi:hypothetical protein